MEPIYNGYGGGTRRGVQCTTGMPCIGDLISNVSFKLNKVGSPTGTCQFAVWDSSNVLKCSLGTIDVSSLTTDSSGEDYELSSPSTTYNLANGDIIACEYTGGDGSNKINQGTEHVNTHTGEAYADYPSNAWRYQTGKNVYFKLNGDDPAEASILLPPPVAWI
jgi:hypothetical protein